MNEIEELQGAYISYKRSDGQLADCVDWAVERMVRGEDEGDVEVILLACSSNDLEIDQLVHNILRKYLGSEAENEELWAGRLLVRLYVKYLAKTISITELDKVILSLYVNLDYPDWMIMLSYNCELSIVHQSYKPFEDEFKYIADLWREAKSLEDFKKKYDIQISNSHDFWHYGAK